MTLKRLVDYRPNLQNNADVLVIYKESGHWLNTIVKLADKTWVAVGLDAGAIDATR